MPAPTQDGSKSETKRAALLLDKIMFAVQKVTKVIIFMKITIYMIMSQALDEKEKPGGGKKGGASANINLASFTGVNNTLDCHAADDEDVLDVIHEAYITIKSSNDHGSS